MTDSGPFAPPPGALPPRPAEPAPPAVPTAPLAPPTGAPIDSVPPTPPPPPPSAPMTAPGSPVGAPIVPPPPRRRGWLIPVIIGGSLAVLALVAGVVFAAVQFAGIVSDPTVAGPGGDGPATGGTDPEFDDLLEGEPGSPVAAEPLTCEACFDLADVRSLSLPDGSYLRVGLPIGDETTYKVSASEEQADSTEWWETDGGTPDACYFIYPKAPLFFEPGVVDDLPARGDQVFFPQWHSDRDEYYVLTEGYRVFDDTAAAADYLTRLESAVAGCPSYSAPDSGWAASLSAEPAFEVPPSVAAYGWVETGGYSRYFAADIQRGNVVLRVTLSTDAYGPSESDFRDLVEEYADLLTELEPEA